MLLGSLEKTITSPEIRGGYLCVKKHLNKFISTTCRISVIINNKEYDKQFDIKKNVLRKGEFVTSVTIPTIEDKWTGVYLKQARKKEVDLATIGVAVLCVRDEVRIALGAAAPIPLRAFKTEELLKGKIIDEPLLEKVGKSILTEVSPISDIRSSQQYREDIIEVLVKRAILQAKGEHIL